MKKKITYLILLGMVAMFAMLNVFTIQVKNGKSLTVYNALLQAKSLEIFAEAGNLPENFPKDPWEGETAASSGAKVRVSENSYTYAYVQIANLYSEYVFPTTIISCFDSGEIPCINGVYLGEGSYIRTLTEQQMKDQKLI